MSKPQYDYNEFLHFQIMSKFFGEINLASHSASTKDFDLAQIYLSHGDHAAFETHIKREIEAYGKNKVKAAFNKMEEKGAHKGLGIVMGKDFGQPHPYYSCENLFKVLKTMV